MRKGESVSERDALGLCAAGVYGVLPPVYGVRFVVRTCVPVESPLDELANDSGELANDMRRAIVRGDGVENIRTCVLDLLVCKILL